MDSGDVEAVSNEEIIDKIKKLQTSHDFDYGHKKFFSHLKLERNIINHK